MAQSLRAVMGRRGKPWHRVGSCSGSCSGVLPSNPCNRAPAHAAQVINALRFNPHLLHWEDLLKKFATINLQVIKW